ncbi:hypothetical protein [Lewinella sp. LCG006]|uniref:hypothetical protein n=1 Tax=Lewinella sp. LCG006 TaxID=3231911 RepID=UPI00345FCB2A
MNKCKKTLPIQSKNLTVIKNEILKKENLIAKKPIEEREFPLDEQQKIHLNRNEERLILSWINPFC